MKCSPVGLKLIMVVSCCVLAGCPEPNPDAPDAKFSASPLAGAAPLTVQFTDESTAPNGPLTTWFWNFGDYTSSAQQHPLHTYQTPDVYTVTLTVAYSGGSDTASKQGYITVREPGTGEGEGEGEGEPIAGELRAFAGIDFIWIPAGSFKMGSALSAEEVAANYGGFIQDFYDEHPQHTVTFANGFWIGRYEVTQAQWETFMDFNPSAFAGDNRPVEGVTWYDCQDFVDALNGEDEGTFRLPSEAEWEYACQAGTSTVFSFGNDATVLPDYAWYSANSADHTHDVGTKTANGWGLYDMHGNVLEWCEDRLHSDYTGAPTDGRAWDQTGGSNRMLRGGSWFYPRHLQRSATRFDYYPWNAYIDVGFRLVREPD